MVNFKREETPNKRSQGLSQLVAYDNRYRTAVSEDWVTSDAVNNVQPEQMIHQNTSKSARYVADQPTTETRIGHGMSNLEHSSLFKFLASSQSSSQ